MWVVKNKNTEHIISMFPTQSEALHAIDMYQIYDYQNDTEIEYYTYYDEDYEL